MDFAFNERQSKLKEDVAAFVEGVNKKQIEACEKASEFPYDLYREISKRGWAGIMVPTEFGGLGLGAVEMAIVTEEIALLGFGTLGLTLQGERAILKLGTPEQQAKYLPRLASGELLSGLAISEAHVGSSLKHMKTRAVKDHGYYVINGHKHSITLADQAGVINVFTMTDNGLTAILVDRDTAGIRTTKLDAVGLRLDPHYDVTFTDCRVPETQLLGEEGQGLKVFFATFNLSRISNASYLIGIARSALHSSIKYATKRFVGDNKIADFQGMQWKIADLATKLEAASLLRFRAAWMEDAGVEHEKETAMAKLFAIELADTVANAAFSIVGSYASYRTAPFERYLRDAKIGLVIGGSSEIMKNNIAREILREYGYKVRK